MNNKQHLWWTGVLAVSTALWLTGCCTCRENRSKGLAIIKCQPMDVDCFDDPNSTATFKVDARGKDLVYQWYFRHGADNPGDVVDPNATTGGRTSELKVSSVDSHKAGFYWCEIDSTGLWGAPIRTRTRDTALSIKAEAIKTLTLNTNIQTFPAQQATMPPPNSGNVCGGTYCGYVNYQNGGAGFHPDAGLTMGYGKVRVGTVYRANTTFHLKWFDSAGGSGCAANSASPETNRKEFTINTNRTYFFTVYFISPCPATGSAVYFEPSFGP